MAEKIDTLDTLSVEVEKELSDEEIKRQKFLDTMEMTNAYYISPENTKSFIVEYLTGSEDDETRTLNREIVRSDVPSDLKNKAIEMYTLEGIMRNTYDRFEAAAKFAKNVQEYIENKDSVETIETIETNNKPEISLNALEEVSTEELFKLKLEIFEDEIVQNSENRELRSAIRKSKNVIELIYNYHLLIKDVE